VLLALHTFLRSTLSMLPATDLPGLLDLLGCRGGLTMLKT
jgi:hypothetical protein